MNLPVLKNSAVLSQEQAQEYMVHRVMAGDDGLYILAAFTPSLV
jgi:hypothetical protein